MKNMRQVLKSFIQDTFPAGASGEPLADDTSLLDNGIIDSTGVLELVDFLEEDFGIEIEDSELVPENLDSINNLLRFLVSKGVADSGKVD